MARERTINIQGFPAAVCWRVPARFRWSHLDARVADAPPAEPVTPALIEGCKKEGQVSITPRTDLPGREKRPGV